MPEISDLNSTLGVLEEELQKLKSASELIGESKEAINAAATVLLKLKETIPPLIEAVGGFIDKIRSADIPNAMDRLDRKLDALSGDVKETQKKVDALEKSTRDDAKLIGQSLQSEIADVKTALKYDLDTKIGAVRDLLERKTLQMEASLKTLKKILLSLIIPALLFSAACLVLLLLKR